MSGLQKPITLSAIQQEFSQGGQIPGRGNQLSDYRGVKAFDHVLDEVVVLPAAPNQLSFSDFENRSWHPNWQYNAPEIVFDTQPQSASVFANNGVAEFVVNVSIADPETPKDPTRPGITGPEPRLGATTFEWQVQEPGDTTWQTVQTTDTFGDQSLLDISLAWNDGAVLDLSGNKYRCVITSTVIAPDEVTGIDSVVATSQSITDEATLTVTVANFDTPVNTFTTVQAQVVNPVVIEDTGELYSRGSVRVFFSGGPAGVVFDSAAPGRTITSQSNSIVWRKRDNSSSAFEDVPSSWLVSGGYDGLQISNITNTDLDGMQLRAVFSASMTQTPPAQTKSDTDITNIVTLSVQFDERPQDPPEPVVTTETETLVETDIETVRDREVGDVFIDSTETDVDVEEEVVFGGTFLRTTTTTTTTTFRAQNITTTDTTQEVTRTFQRTVTTTEFFDGTIDVDTGPYELVSTSINILNENVTVQKKDRRDLTTTFVDVESSLTPIPQPPDPEPPAPPETYSGTLVGIEPLQSFPATQFVNSNNIPACGSPCTGTGDGSVSQPAGRCFIEYGFADKFVTIYTAVCSATGGSPPPTPPPPPPPFGGVQPPIGTVIEIQ